MTLRPVEGLSEPSQEPSGAVSEAVASSLAAMTWLASADQGLVALAKAYAAQIDASEDAKTVRWVGPQLFTVLQALGGAPAARKALGVEEQVHGKLAQLRAAR